GWWIVLRDRDVESLGQAAAALVVAVAVFWLANARMLMHPIESVQTYLVLLMLVAGGGFVARWLEAAPGSARGRHLAAALGCAFVGTFGFGTGLVAFPALAVVLVVGRAPLAAVASVLAAMLAALALYLLLPGGGHVPGVAAIDPWRNLQVAAQWLASPVATLTGEPLHPGTSSLVPIEPRLVPPGSLPPLAAWIGFAGMAALALASLQRWRRGRLGRTETLALALGWFALGAALLVGLTRLKYFEAHPDQLFAGRYLPWPCMLWASLALLALGDPQARRTRWPLLPRPAVVVVAAVAVAALLQNPAHARWARQAQAMARFHAVAVLADLWSTPRMAGETTTADVEAATPLLREHRIAMFAHPAALRLGTVLHEAADSVDASAPTRAVAYRSDKGEAALYVEAALPAGYVAGPPDLWLLTDGQRRVLGYGHPMPLASRTDIAGVAREPADGLLLAFPWTDEGVGAGVRLALPR
ncbi:MAG TPA: hypothetical protein VFX05_16130, partial [Casimicrobiaceae bacterium]|nr:hypothetical protein [Casimicrobiaceae bacterium]